MKGGWCVYRAWGRLSRRTEASRAVWGPQYRRGIAARRHRRVVVRCSRWSAMRAAPPGQRSNVNERCLIFRLHHGAL